MIRNGIGAEKVSDSDIFCIVLAGLLHDVGHPCFSHQFEEFMRSVGAKIETMTVEEFQSSPLVSDCEKERAKENANYPKELAQQMRDWSHEDASQTIVEYMWNDLREHVKYEGLTDTDLTCVLELIHPPDKELIEAQKQGRLAEMLKKNLKNISGT